MKPVLLCSVAPAVLLVKYCPCSVVSCLSRLTRATQLLARLVRDYDRAERFIRAGGASSLLALPGASAFEGSTALIAVVFRCAAARSLRVFLLFACVVFVFCSFFCVCGVFFFRV